jgi:hypothetical protein
MSDHPPPPVGRIEFAPQNTEAERLKLRLMRESDRRAIDRWVPCPDHRDKTEPGRCYVCENERLRKALHLCAASASLPDPQEACRLILRTSQEALRV